MSAVSVVIPSYGRPTTLMLVLQSLAQQKFIDEILFEVLVVLDGSQPSILASLQLPDTPYPLSILTQEHRGPAAARNRGVAAAQGDLILFLDDDVVPAPHWMAEHVAAHRLLERRSVVFGPMLSPQDKVLQPWVAWEQHQLHEKYARLQCGELAANPHQFYTGNASLYRADFLRVGGFDESLWRSEDVELAYRLAATQIAFHFAERAESYHYAERSYENWSSLPYVYGCNSVVLV
ncbi:MAG: glycosyltransferase, partial [Caldilineaceae bacterium]|nr:glycosyltransferase [Caldilineaceae bacterium]